MSAEPAPETIGQAAPSLSRIPKLVALLASDRDGEVLGAVEALKRTLCANRYDFNDLAVWVRLPAVIGNPKCEWPPLWNELTDSERRSWLNKAMLADCLNSRSRDFVEDRLLQARNGFWPMTAKQEAWLNDILFTAYRHGVRA